MATAIAAAATASRPLAASGIPVTRPARTISSTTTTILRRFSFAGGPNDSTVACPSSGAKPSFTCSPSTATTVAPGYAAFQRRELQTTTASTAAATAAAPPPIVKPSSAQKRSICHVIRSRKEAPLVNNNNNNTNNNNNNNININNNNKNNINLPPYVYHPDYTCPWPSKHRFPMWKFKDIYDISKERGLVSDNNIFRPVEDPPDEWFLAVHDEDYYRGVVTGTLEDSAERRIGFRGEMQQEAWIRRTVLECAGTVKTVELALRHGIAANFAGGTHHAYQSFGSGFTVLNDLAISARWALANAGVERVLIVDLDVHQGDGTASIFLGDPKVFTFSMHCGANFPFRKQTSDLDVALEKFVGDEEYLATLEHHLAQVLRDFMPDLVIYDAGVDIWQGDKLGHLCITNSGIFRRDYHVIDTCCKAGIPVACVVGGGYDVNARELARRHGLVHVAAARVWQSHDKPPLDRPFDASERDE